MKVRTALAGASLIVASLSIVTPASASPCEPGDPNCNTGCELINKTPVVNKLASCNT